MNQKSKHLASQCGNKTFLYYFFFFHRLSERENKETKKEKKRERIWLISHCAWKISDSFGVTYKDLGKPLFKLSWAAHFWPTTALGHVDKLPASHLFIFLLCISTVQQVYTGKINVTALWKGKTYAGTCHINHLSQRFSRGLSFCAVRKVWSCRKRCKKGKNKNVWRHFN